MISFPWGEKKCNFWWIFLKLSFLSLIPLLLFLYCFRLCLTLFSCLSFHLSSSCSFLLPPLNPSSSSIILSFHVHFLNYLPFFPSLLFFSMFFFSFLPSLASSLIFLLTLYIFPTHIHRPHHFEVKGMVTVLWGSEGMER